MQHKVAHSLAALHTVRQRYIEQGEVPLSWKMALTTMFNDPECRFTPAHLPASFQKQMHEQYKALKEPEIPWAAWARMTGLDYIRTSPRCPAPWLREIADTTTTRINKLLDDKLELETKLAKAKAAVKALRVQYGRIGSESDAGQSSSDSDDDDEDEESQVEKLPDPTLDNPFLDTIDNATAAYIREAKVVDTEEHWGRVEKFARDYRRQITDDAKAEVLARWHKYQEGTWTVHKRPQGVDVWPEGQQLARKQPPPPLSLSLSLSLSILVLVRY